MTLSDQLFQSFCDGQTLLNRFLEDKDQIKHVAQVSECLANTFDAGGKLLVCGNGGSACDAMHVAEEFTGRFRKNRRALPAIALADPSHITCVANDFGYDAVFSRGVEAYGKSGDVLIGLSTSGQSINVIKAIETAKQQNMITVGMLGKDGGALAGQCDFEFIIPEKTSDRIQELHMMILHIVIEGVERILFPSLY